jgi:hypothetical protein
MSGPASAPTTIEGCRMAQAQHWPHAVTDADGGRDHPLGSQRAWAAGAIPYRSTCLTNVPGLDQPPGLLNHFVGAREQRRGPCVPSGAPASQLPPQATTREHRRREAQQAQHKEALIENHEERRNGEGNWRVLRIRDRSHSARAARVHCSVPKPP